MAQLIVTANKLNKRKSVPPNLPEATGIAGIVNKGFTFTGEEADASEVPNSALGKWFKDRDGYYYWGGGVMTTSNVSLISTPTNISIKTSFNWFDSLNINTIWDTHQEKGSSAKIAILDTGFSTVNSDVSNAIILSNIIIDSIQYPGIDLIINDQSNDGHGTRCSSLLASKNNSQWIIGIAPESNLISGKISINREIRDFQYIIDGIDWAIKQGADIISISYAVEIDDEQTVKSWNTKFESLLANNNVLVFAAAGNSDGTQTFGERYPASFPKCISVGAIDENKNLSLLTVLSNKTILHAPGINVESFGLTNAPSPESGTSFSTPIVAAIASLAVSFLKKNNKAISRDALLNKMINSGDNISGFPSKKIINITNLFAQL